MRRWRLPVGLVVAGVVVSIVVGRLPHWWVQVRQFYVLGFTPDDVYYLSLFVGPLVLLVGMSIATARLAASDRTQGAAVLAGIATILGAAFFCWSAFVCFVFSQMDVRTEIALADGESIVVTASSFHHCDVSVRQRDGIFIDTFLGSTFDELPCGAFSKGDYTVEQHGDVVTLRAGGESLTVTLRE